METHHANSCLFINGIGDTSAFVIKGDAPSFVMGDEMGDVSAFMTAKQLAELRIRLKNC
jgi:hypothetical protein